MANKLNTWGPITVAAVLALIFVLGGGAVNVVLNDYSYTQYVKDVQYIVAALAAAAGVGRGLARAR
jgi:hypothetical protein